MSTPARSTLARDRTRARLKHAALRLFAQRGVDGVPVRDIVAAAGVRNGASIHYYFGSKEQLIRELVVDGARRIDARRNAALDAMETGGGPASLADVVRLLVETSIEADAGEPPGASPDPGYLGFIGTLQRSHRRLFLDALENRWNSGYLRCLRHLERLLPQLPADLRNQRLIFMSLYLSATLAAREAAIERPAASNTLWRTPWALDNLVDSLCGLLERPPGARTAQASDAVAAAAARSDARAPRRPAGARASIAGGRRPRAD